MVLCLCCAVCVCVCVVSTREYQYQRRAANGGTVGAAFEPHVQQRMYFAPLSVAYNGGSEPVRRVTSEDAAIDAHSEQVVQTPMSSISISTGTGTGTGTGNGNVARSFSDDALPHNFTTYNGRELPVIGQPADSFHSLSSSSAALAASGQGQGAGSGVGAGVAPRSARELYDEHVALSKRIQRQQLAAMLGIGLDFDINSNSYNSGRGANSVNADGLANANPSTGNMSDIGLDVE
jgi:hypothetical protein